MAQDTDTRPIESAPFRINHVMDYYWGGPERRISGLTLRIFAVNLAALLMLLIGVQYVGQYQQQLIETKLEIFKTQVELISATLSDAALDQDRLRRQTLALSRKLQERIFIFDSKGALLLDSYALAGGKNLADYIPRSKLKEFDSLRVLKNVGRVLFSGAPDEKTLPYYPNPQSGRIEDYPDAGEGLRGVTSISAWLNASDKIFLSAATPLFYRGAPYGALLVTRDAPDIEDDITIVWFNIFKAFCVTLILMTALSIYLSGTIASPLKKLARAADSLRGGRMRDVEIPDFSGRHDEIGELSVVLRETTQALRDRMHAIEHFAADVAHELKNPLTSLRSAVETLPIVKAPQDKERLLRIIMHDLQRMDRLISDISAASRLDAELSRDVMEKISLSHVMHLLMEQYRDPLDRFHTEGKNWDIQAQKDNVVFSVDCSEAEDIFVYGSESRFLQVLENITANAMSFSPPGGHIKIKIERYKNQVIIEISDEGPGIPENKLETIFERFYSERPGHEDFGTHSGLGLSISRQIIEAMQGRLYARNIQDPSGSVLGACFTVELDCV